MCIRDRGHDGKARRHSVAVGDGKAAAPLDGMAYCVAQIQKLPFALLRGVTFHHTGLVGNTPGDDFRQVQGAGFEEGEEALVTQNAGLNGLGGAVGQNLRRQGGQTVRVAQHGGRLEERSRQVFSSAQVLSLIHISAAVAYVGIILWYGNKRSSKLNINK